MAYRLPRRPLANGRARRSKFYAVRVGKIPGVYETWDECRAEVHKYSGAVFKSFKSRVEAEEFVKVNDDGPAAAEDRAEHPPEQEVRGDAA